MSNITKLPDGSAFFTSAILSDAEIAALPRNKRPLNHRISSEIYRAVFESIGSASMQWNPRPTGEFDSTGASNVAVELCLKIADEVERAQPLPVITGTGKPLTRKDVIDGLNEAYQGMLENDQRNDFSLTGYPDMVAILKHIEIHGIPPK